MPAPRLSLKRRLALAALAAPILAGSGFALAQTQAPATSPAAPVKVADLRDMNAIRLEGRVAELFGNRFVLEDATGRTLVETGPRADLVKVGDAVSVEGAFRGGEVHAEGIRVGGGERIALERPRPDRGPGREGPGRKGPGHGGPDHEGPGGPRPPHEERAGREDRGGWFGRSALDTDAAAKALAEAGYTDVGLRDTKRHHAEFTATDAAGRRWTVKVDEDNAIAEREPYVAPLDEAGAKSALETLGYTYLGDYEAHPRHVEAEAKDRSGRKALIELNFDGTLRKERFES